MRFNILLDTKREITLLKDFNSNKALVNNPSLHIKNIIKDSNGIIAVSLYEDHDYLYLLKLEESKYIVNKIKVGGIIKSPIEKLVEFHFRK